MIVLIRHGEAENAGGRAIGQTDLPLSENGKLQADMLAEALSGIRFRTFLSSPLDRTMHTARLIEKKSSNSISPCSALAEINLGDWDGLSFEDIKSRFPQGYKERGRNIAGYRPPGGESFLDLRERVSPMLAQLSEEKLPALLITHAGVIRVIMQLVLDFPLENIFGIVPSHCHATVLKNGKKGFTVSGFNLPPGSDLSGFLENIVPKQR
ncbi:histidine phosphatase family protein [Maridesulfovibrio sp.]|uniref:histidine phosphatase family protein n=1 Tax=Maridesulfovibrio sp. TaxID=2795000 RepID=UPI002A189A37|nr:histidine phosphatase family protein [Maridesulfovibrio sp.]